MIRTPATVATRCISRTIGAGLQQALLVVAMCFPEVGQKEKFEKVLHDTGKMTRRTK